MNYFVVSNIHVDHGQRERDREWLEMYASESSSTF